MPNDAKCGLVVGVGLVIAVGIIFFQRADPKPSAGIPPAVSASAPRPSNDSPAAPNALEQQSPIQDEARQAKETPARPVGERRTEPE